MTYPIVIYGHPVLRKLAEDIEKDYPGLQSVISDLFETMYKSEGLGLAAPQIGKSIRIFVIDGAPVAEDEPSLAGFKKAFINAHISERCGELQPMNEGCLSIPDLTANVRRATTIGCCSKATCRDSTGSAGSSTAAAWALLTAGSRRSRRAEPAPGDAVWGGRRSAG